MLQLHRITDDLLVNPIAFAHEKFNVWNEYPDTCL